jgi:hypothetical protein
VHVILEVDLVMDASTQNVRGQGTARLMADYCNEPGNQISEIPITFMTPANDRAQFVYMLRGQRNFLNMPGILDTETNISIILNVQNRPVE